MKTESFPTTSPLWTKKVRAVFAFTVPLSVVFCHQGVLATTSPRWLMTAEMPVLAQRAMSRRVSMALSEA